jgi:tight adherence protein C
VTAESEVSQRLKTLIPTAASPRAREAVKQRPSFIHELITGIGRYGFGGSEKSLGQTLSCAGIRTPNAVFFFLGVRTLLSFGPALMFLVPAVSAGNPLGPVLLKAIAVGAAGHILMNMSMKLRAKSRARRITDALPDTLDLMVICLEAGLGLNATIARVGDERQNMNDPLGDEFGLVALELKSGRGREESLRSLGDRNGVDDLKSLAGLIVQSDKLGASMGKTLRAHADLLRTKRRQRAEEAARKLPIKMLFPLAFFILPALFIVVGGPAMLRLKDLVDLVVNH